MGREGEREGEKHQCGVASCAPPTGDLAHNSGMCPDWESKSRPFCSQVGTQSTEPHQPGFNQIFLPFKEKASKAIVCFLGFFRVGGTVSVLLSSQVALFCQ